MARSTSSKWPRREQLGLAAEELEPARPRLLDAPLDVAVLLGGHREEDHAAGQVLEGLGAPPGPSPLRAAPPPGHCGRRHGPRRSAGSATGCPATTRPSSSPSKREGRPVLGAPRPRRARPVIARPALGASPSPLSVSSTSRAVLNSLKPSSGCRRMVSPIADDLRRHCGRWPRRMLCFNAAAVVMARPFAVRAIGGGSGAGWRGRSSRALPRASRKARGGIARAGGGQDGGDHADADGPRGEHVPDSRRGDPADGEHGRGHRGRHLAHRPRGPAGAIADAWTAMSKTGPKTMKSAPRPRPSAPPRRSERRRRP